MLSPDVPHEARRVWKLGHAEVEDQEIRGCRRNGARELRPVLHFPYTEEGGIGAEQPSQSVTYQKMIVCNQHTGTIFIRHEVFFSMRLVDCNVHLPRLVCGGVERLMRGSSGLPTTTSKAVKVTQTCPSEEILGNRDSTAEYGRQAYAP